MTVSANNEIFAAIFIPASRVDYKQLTSAMWSVFLCDNPSQFSSNHCYHLS